MKKTHKMFTFMFLVLLIFALTGMAFATGPDNDNHSIEGPITGNATTGSNNVQQYVGPQTATGGSLILQPGAVQGGAGGNVTNTQIGGTFAPTFKPTNINSVTVKPNIDTNIGNGIGNFSPSAKATIEKGAVVNSPTFVNDPTFSPSLSLGVQVGVTSTNNPTNTNTFNPSNTNQQKQDQEQRQTQGQVNNQTIAPVQQTTINNPDKLAIGSAPNITDTELNFISPNERDVQTILPKFGCDTIKPIVASDCVVDVLWQSNDLPFKSLYKKVLEGLRSSEVKKYNAKAVRYQIREAASTKTWTTGGELAGNTIGMIGNAVSGAAGGVFPKIGRSKSSNLYTIMFLLVQDFKN